jgi:hypothetical protein
MPCHAVAIQSEPSHLVMYDVIVIVIVIASCVAKFDGILQSLCSSPGKNTSHYSSDEIWCVVSKPSHPSEWFPCPSGVTLY